MSRRRRGNGRFVAKAAPNGGVLVPVEKAGIDATDAGIFAGTLADASVQHMPDAEQYWLLFKKHPIVRACVRVIANAVAQEGFDVVPTDGDDLDENDPNVELLHDYFHQAFIGRANTYRKWVKATTIDMEVFGWAFTRKKKAPLDVDGQAKDVPCFLERLDPRLVHPKLNADKTEIETFVLKRSTYNYDGVVVDAGVSDASAAQAVNGETIDPDEIIMFSLDEGGDTVLGSPSPLEALDLTCAMDLNVRQHRNSFFRNGAQTGNVFINEEADEDSVRAAEKAIIAMKVGPRNAFKNVFLVGQWKVQALQKQGNNDLDFIQGSELVRDEICAVYNVPVGKLFSITGALGQAGKGEDDETFEQECVLPIEENIYQTLTNELLVKEFDIQDLKLVPKRRNKIHADRFDAAMKMVKFGATGNQALDFVGLPKSDAPGMDVPLFLQSGAGVGMDEPVPQGEAQDTSSELQDATQSQDEVAKRKARPFDPTRKPKLSYLNDFMASSPKSGNG